MRWLDSITDSMDMNMSKFREIVEDRGDWHATVHGIANSRTWLSDLTTTTIRRPGPSVVYAKRRPEKKYIYIYMQKSKVFLKVAASLESLNPK